MADDLRERVQDIVGQSIKTATGMDMELTDDLSLIEGGILDSMTMVVVVQTLQTEFDVEIDFADLTLENFDNLGVLVPFLSSLLAAKP